MQEIHLHVIDIFIAKYVMMKYKQKKTTELFILKRTKKLKYKIRNTPQKTHTDVVTSTEKNIILGFPLSVMMSYC